MVSDSHCILKVKNSGKILMRAAMEISCGAPDKQSGRNIILPGKGDQCLTVLAIETYVHPRNLPVRFWSPH